MRRFTSVHDVINGPGLDVFLKDAMEFSRHPWIDVEIGHRKTIGLLFMNASLRTRMSTQRAASMLGAETIVLNAGTDSWTLETRDGVVMDGNTTEHIKDAAAVMGAYCDVLGLRTFASLTDRDLDYNETVLESFVKHSGVPVISLESATRHPLQSFADMLTIHQHKQKARPKVVLTWAPHPKALPQAVANSFIEWMSVANAELIVTHPPGYELSPNFVQGVSVTHNQNEAFTGADFVYAKNWSAYSEYGQILSKDPSWTIDAQKMKLTNNARFMHCLPVRRNMIVTDEVLDGPSSLIIPQAGNRIVAAQTVLYHMLKGLM